MDLAGLTTATWALTESEVKFVNGSNLVQARAPPAPAPPRSRARAGPDGAHVHCHCAQVEIRDWMGVEYFDLDVTFTAASARAGGAPAAGAVARASWAWRPGTRDAVLFSIRAPVRPGDADFTLYPSGSAASFAGREFPCQVLSLSRVAASHFSLASGRLATLAARTAPLALAHAACASAVRALLSRAGACPALAAALLYRNASAAARGSSDAAGAEVPPPVLSGHAASLPPY